MYLFRIFIVAISLQSALVLADPAKKQEPRTNPTGKLPRGEPTKDPDAIEINEKVLDQSLIDQAHIHSKDGDTKWRYAAGVNLAWSIRKDYGARTFRRFEPEAVGYIYTELPWSSLWLRHAARLGYSNDQPQMPQAVRMEETDWKFALEEGLIWNWYVAPSIAFGVGYDWRTIRVKSSSPVTSVDSRLNSKETFLWSYLQMGVGIPALQGSFELQPTIRWQNLVNDTRTTWAFGFEATKAW